MYQQATLHVKLISAFMRSLKRTLQTWNFLFMWHPVWNICLSATYVNDLCLWYLCNFAVKWMYKHIPTVPLLAQAAGRYVSNFTHYSKSRFGILFVETSLRYCMAGVGGALGKPIKLRSRVGAGLGILEGARCSVNRTSAAIKSTSEQHQNYAVLVTRNTSHMYASSRLFPMESGGIWSRNFFNVTYT